MAKALSKQQNVNLSKRQELIPTTNLFNWILCHRYQRYIFRNSKDQKGFWVIPEYCFAVKLESPSLIISSEHTSVKWVSYDEAISSLKYDSNKTALWELRQRISSVSS